MPEAKVNIRPGVSVLSVLRYLNYEPWFALAEFVDNAVQSYAENKARLHEAEGTKWQLRVLIDIDTSPPARIVIRDNACGISRDVFPRAFRPAVTASGPFGPFRVRNGHEERRLLVLANMAGTDKGARREVERTVRFDIEKIVRDELEELSIEESRGTDAASLYRDSA